MAKAVDRWEEEGGAPGTLWRLPYETGDLLDVERRILECLGGALGRAHSNGQDQAHQDRSRRGHVRR
jgi:hypothetical protein